MKNLILALFVFAGAIVFSACPQKDIVLYSDCVQALIDSLEAIPVLSPPARVEEWTVGTEKYIYSTSDCCDFFNYLRNLDCEMICAPDGGITGMGDGNCPDLKNVEKMLIWEDNR